jgi:hypothetical protein
VNQLVHKNSDIIISLIENFSIIFTFIGNEREIFVLSTLMRVGRVAQSV